MGNAIIHDIPKEQPMNTRASIAQHLLAKIQESARKAVEAEKACLPQLAKYHTQRVDSCVAGAAALGFRSVAERTAEQVRKQSKC